MAPNDYTTIPPTTDLNYWRQKRSNGKERYTTFEPINPELHRELRSAAWAKIQSRLPASLRAKPAY